ncbi:nuclear envelope integral membrane protein-like [Euwallacea fornicatus]|uniref:nuclear envelope integral membrane protein-like n=1 Tax=Euwallacea fornicatus TaxID=995702 RepID=UPI00338FA3B8
MNSLLTIILFFHLTVGQSGTASAGSSNAVYYLEHNESHNFKPETMYGRRELQVFCYQGKPKYIIHIWQSVLLKIIHPSDDYNQFDGATPEEVQQEYHDKSYSWSVNLFSTKSKNIKLNPFNMSCIGIESRDQYTIYLQVIAMDLWKVLTLVMGLTLFLSASTLSCNSLFHYICGISLGVCASFLILIYFISKLFPRKTLMYGIIGAGSTILIYFLQMIWDNMKVIMSTYQAYVIWYTVTTASISFILCYRWGPVENPKTINLIKWTLQLMGLVAIFFSSQYQEAAMAQVILVVLFTYLPSNWKMAPGRYWKRRFPPKVKALTNDEYYEQGVRETSKALKELRDYCSSPKCNQWKTAMKIKDVKRFASFVEGNSHLCDDEILEYETSIHGNLTDDSDERDSEMSDDENC